MATIPINQDEIIIAQLAVRKYVDGTLYGRFVSDNHCQEIAVAVVTAVESFRGGKEI